MFSSRFSLILLVSESLSHVYNADIWNIISANQRHITYHKTREIFNCKWMVVRCVALDV